MTTITIDQETDVTVCLPVNCNECPYRRAQQIGPQQPRRYGRLTIAVGIMMWDGQDLGVTMTEYNLIEQLVHADGEYVSYRAIYDVMKGVPGFVAGEGKNGYRVNVRSAVKRIRKKFMVIDADFVGIENLQCLGYRLLLRGRP